MKQGSKMKALLLLLSVALISGCGQKIKQETGAADQAAASVQTEVSEKDTEAVTEMVTEKETDPPELSAGTVYEIEPETETEAPETEYVNGYAVCLDPGHQGSWVDMSAVEPNAPGSGEMKTKSTTGTQGSFTGVPEYELNLNVSLGLREELENRGYRVVMTRENNDTAISNSERATLAYTSGCDVYVRIHANGSDDPSVRGALAMTMSPSNAYVGNLYDQSYRLAESILNNYCSKAGFDNLGIQYYDNMTGINWSKIPVMILEMGFMTNESDDTRMEDPGVQELMVSGIADGIDVYFGLDPAREIPQNGQSSPDHSVSADAGGMIDPDAAEDHPEPAPADHAEPMGEDHPEPAPGSENAGSEMPAPGNTETSAEVSAEAALQASAEEGKAFLPGSGIYENLIAQRESMGEVWALSFEDLSAETKAGDADETAEAKAGDADEEAEKNTEEETETVTEAETESVSETVTESDNIEDGDVEKNENVFGFNADRRMQSASVIKIFIMGAVYDRICYPKEDAEPIAYTEGYEGELRSLLEAMITVSDNTAANRLIEILGEGDFTVGAGVVNKFCEEHGYKEVHVGRRFLDSQPTDDNYISADACRKFLAEVYRGELVCEEASEKMLTILKGQTVTYKIPSGLPEGFSSANKTGEMPEGYGLGCIENDAALIFSPYGDYVLVVLSNELGGRNDQALDVIRSISSAAASYYIQENS